MRRTSVMTLGFVLIFIGIQLNMVETYVLTPRFSNFLSENAPDINDPSLANSTASAIDQYASPYYQASYPGNHAVRQPAFPQLTRAITRSGPRAVSPPNWLCWPVLFLGTVVFLHGLSMRRD